jgi:hypothetical protein
MHGVEGKTGIGKKALTGFEPVIKALQAPALPLGYSAVTRWLASMSGQNLSIGNRDQDQDALAWDTETVAGRNRRSAGT